jgi:hypothetical protein
MQELPADDAAYLQDRGLEHQATSESGMLCIVLPAFPLPSGYNRETADLLIRLPGGYPDVPPDMWWFDPAIRGAGGEAIRNTESIETHLGRQWQRWSRHFSAGQWKSGIDGLESYIALISRDLQESVPPKAAA